MKNSLKSKLVAPVIEPYARYLYANVLHAIRLGVAVVATLLFSNWAAIPHSEWATITVFIILGLLQYQGAIYTKASERILGTVLGIVVGLFLLWINQDLLAPLGAMWLYYIIVGIISSFIGYFSIKNLGYIGLLTGITMCMIIASSNSIGPDGIARAINVLIGTLFAVVASLILPLKSTLMWRFLLANNLVACAKMYDGVEAYISDPSLDNRFANAENEDSETNNKELSLDHPVIANPANLGTNDVHLDLGATTISTVMDGTPKDTVPTYVNKDMVAQFKKINQRLLKVRGHIAPTARESGIDTQTLDMIQRTHRNIIGTIDLLLSAAPKLAHSPIDDENRILVDHYHRELTQGMRHIAAVLRSPNDEVFRPITRIQVADYPSIKQLTFEWQGYFWLTQSLQQQLQSLSELLQDTQTKWYAGSGLRYQRQERRRIHAHGRETNLDI